MRMVLLAALSLAAFGGFVSSSATSTRTPACTKVGTGGNDFLAGTKGADVICALGGRDYIAGRRGNDSLLGGPGTDTLVANEGHDRTSGGPGKDQLFAVDDQGGDLVAGNGGFDRCYIDPGDRTRGCEVVRVSRAPVETATVEALSTTTANAITYGEEVQDCFQADPACPPPNQ